MVAEPETGARRRDGDKVSGQRLVRRVRRHRAPAWWRHAKLGIFVHWTPASVPAFAPVGAEMAELLGRRDPHALAWSPYAEWYQNSLAFPESPVAAHHAATYGDRPYEDFIADFEAGLAGWDPEDWAGRFAAAGARYVVLVTKHHDGYCLWPTRVANPNRVHHHCDRDLVGELADAVRSRGMRFGVYYSGGLDWTFNDHRLGAFSDLLLAQPRGDYPAYAEAQVRELIDRYRPSVLWNDISWPAPAGRLASLLADYYAAVPDGVVNDRFMPSSALLRLATTRLGRAALDRAAAAGARAEQGLVPPRPPLYDFRTPEYTAFDDVRSEPWECVRGMDRSFGHNQASGEHDFLSRRDLLWSLVDVTAKGGNLLLNVGPRGIDARIPDRQQVRLDWLGSFTAATGDALYATAPWWAAGGGGAGFDVAYTARDHDVFAFVRAAGPVGRAAGDPNPSPVVLAEVAATAATEVTTPGGRRLGAAGTPGGLRVDLEEPLDDAVPTVVRLRHVAARSPSARR